VQRLIRQRTPSLIGAALAGQWISHVEPPQGTSLTMGQIYRNDNIASTDSRSNNGEIRRCQLPQEAAGDPYDTHIELGVVT